MAAGLATSGDDGKVRPSGAWPPALIAGDLDGGSPWIPRLACSADGRTLAAAGGDDHIRVWDIAGIGEATADQSRR